LRYASFNYLPGINYIQIGCGGTFTNQTAQESLYEILCSNIQLKNTNLTSVYTYSVIYGTTSEMSLLESILNKPNATSSVSIPDPIRTIPFGSAYATNSSGTISVLIDQSWTYGELFTAFWEILILIILLFVGIFFILK
jgi:hypothetical protein